MCSYTDAHAHVRRLLRAALPACVPVCRRKRERERDKGHEERDDGDDAHTDVHDLHLQSHSRLPSMLLVIFHFPRLPCLCLSLVLLSLSLQLLSLFVSPSSDISDIEILNYCSLLSPALPVLHV